MLFANLEFETLPEERDHCVETTRAMKRFTQEEAGRIATSFTANLDDPDWFRITEIKTGSDQVGAHLARLYVQHADAVTGVSRR
jgi:quinol monooxygenase YgiN